MNDHTEVLICARIAARLLIVESSAPRAHAVARWNVGMILEFKDPTVAKSYRGCILKTYQPIRAFL